MGLCLDIPKTYLLILLLYKYFYTGWQRICLVSGGGHIGTIPSIRAWGGYSWKDLLKRESLGIGVRQSREQRQVLVTHPGYWGQFLPVLVLQGQSDHRE